MLRAFVYILASKPNGTLYIGVTNDLIRRVHQHKAGVSQGFVTKYNVSMLVYYEIYDCIVPALRREKQLKKWNRAWKIKLIEEKNHQWAYLYEQIAKW